MISLHEEIVTRLCRSDGLYWIYGPIVADWLTFSYTDNNTRRFLHTQGL